MKTLRKNISMFIILTISIGFMLTITSCSPKFGCPGAITKECVKTPTKNI